VDGKPLVLTQEWAKPLQQDDILSLVDFPHFGHSGMVTLCIFFLLTLLHGGYLWLGGKYLVDEETIQRLSTYPCMEMNWKKYLATKDASQHEIYGTYSTHHKCVGY
jgi:hypothetical protein